MILSCSFSKQCSTDLSDSNTEPEPCGSVFCIIVGFLLGHKYHTVASALWTKFPLFRALKNTAALWKLLVQFTPSNLPIAAGKILYSPFCTHSGSFQLCLFCGVKNAHSNIWTNDSTMFVTISLVSATHSVPLLLLLVYLRLKCICMEQLTYRISIAAPYVGGGHALLAGDPLTGWSSGCCAGMFSNLIFQQSTVGKHYNYTHKDVT